MTGLGGLDETGDGGEGGGLENGRRNWVTIGGGLFGEAWAEGASRVISGSAGGTGGGDRVGLVGCFRCKVRVTSAVSR